MWSRGNQEQVHDNFTSVTCSPMCSAIYLGMLPGNRKKLSMQHRCAVEELAFKNHNVVAILATDESLHCRNLLGAQDFCVIALIAAALDVNSSLRKRFPGFCIAYKPRSFPTHCLLSQMPVGLAALVPSRER
jgi:hypothetical protein